MVTSVMFVHSVYSAYRYVSDSRAAKLGWSFITACKLVFCSPLVILTDKGFRHGMQLPPIITNPLSVTKAPTRKPKSRKQAQLPIRLAKEFGLVKFPPTVVTMGSICVCIIYPLDRFKYHRDL